MSRNNEKNVAELVYRQAAATLQHAAAMARRMGLGLTDLHALEHLSRGELTPKQLGERLFVSPGAVTALVDRLEKVGHLERVANPKDRRSSLLRTTRSGREAIVAQVLPLAANVERIAAGLSEQELATVEGFVREVTAATARQAQSPGRAVDGAPGGPG
jgi:DNA-binding MarR family transcriptional regulator